ncbi:hypothetical protein CVIRNUC_006904 [Coccomyxa viridis]|uniref:Uncharacterized protein n=1 Tax=Coccomyxa viridis TaxID=1274662 RepID=A0AAV1IBM2_9CHLO|nr:hypothetical protein CVIRNUC_006904 [Coccomyxa viridis]
MPKRKADSEPPRRTGRKRRTVQEADKAQAEEAPRKVPPAYKPNASKGEKVKPALLEKGKDKRDARGRLVFKDFPKFRPTLRPKDVIQAGSLGGIYFNPKGGRPGILSPKGVDIDHKEFPADWFEGLRPEQYIGRRYNVELNKYKVKAGQNQAQWEEKGWIKPEYDPRGWFHWYCRFYMGRRIDDDARQIGRWMGVAGEKGRWKRSLVNKVVAANKTWDDPSVSPVVRQSLLHWAYELTEADFEAMRKGV